MIRVGLISDTHGLLRQEALDFLQGAHHVIHAGDIGDRRILDALGEIAPVTAVRGNNDVVGWKHVPDTDTLQVGDVLVHVIHDANDLIPRRLPPSVRVVVSGHTHQPAIVERDAVLYVNPGSAGPRRFRLPVSVAELIVRGDSVSARLVELRL
jgi:uncharacterized protein